MEHVFKALAATSRRKVLDALFRVDGQTLTELCATASMTRQGLSRHLQVLEDAGLIVTEFRGREKRHFLNPVPIREMTERWLRKYSENQLQAIDHLKKTVEKPEMNKHAFAYQTWIRAPRQRVWASLTDPAFTSKYFHATHVDSTWDPGAEIFYRYAPDGEIAVDGRVLEIDPPNRLVISWHVRYDERAIREQPSRVTFTLDEDNGQTRLKIVHDQFPDDSVVFEGISEGWPWIISSMKSLLETGEALPSAAA